MSRDDDFYIPERESRTRRPAVAAQAEEDVDNELDSRVVDLDTDEESSFLRAQKRIPVRRGALPKKTANRLKQVSIALLLLGVVAAALATAYFYGTGSWRFRIDSSDNIEVAGTQNVTHGQVMEIVGGDIGRNIFFVPLADRKKQLEEIPWVESATVMRLLPNHLRIEIHERTPIGFVRIGSKVSLIDASGVVLELPPHSAAKYSFPVIAGMEESDPLSTRAARMKIYGELVHDLDSEGAHYSSSISEVDLSDPEDVKITVADPEGAVLIHLGSSQFLERYKIYLAHIEDWRQQFKKVESVDLRYDHQVIVNPETSSNRERTDSTTGNATQTQASSNTAPRNTAPRSTKPKPVAAPHPAAGNAHNKRHH
ncbi:MAG TPA: FtsQ-type POTRA domain-containing protein [Terriglobales bacterium]|jgi:cell division protein FtsQ|nr:FtsQ-type POTRA domain-containing protein [Terriglobales bacterium]